MPFAPFLAWIQRGPSDREPVVAAAMGYHQFETIHPFNDGNGRIGRLVVVLQLMSDGVLADPLLSISSWFERRRQEYQDRLLAVSSTGDWYGWVSFSHAGSRRQPTTLLSAPGISLPYRGTSMRCRENTRPPAPSETSPVS